MFCFYVPGELFDKYRHHDCDDVTDSDSQSETSSTVKSRGQSSSSCVTTGSPGVAEGQLPHNGDDDDDCVSDKTSSTDDDDDDDF